MPVATFPQINSDFLFTGGPSGSAWAPGAAQFNSAIKFYQDQLQRNSRGQGLPQLASARAADPVGSAYEAQPYLGGGGEGQAGGLSGGVTAASATAKYHTLPANHCPELSTVLRLSTDDLPAIQGARLVRLGGEV
jgi:hypothetical protein